jgi:filamentous hemagglutinin
MTRRRWSGRSNDRGPGRLIVAEGAYPSAAEVRAAQLLAAQGYDVVLQPPVGKRSPAGATADLLVNGVPYDTYTPRTASVDRIISAIASKGNQATGVVLDLSDTTVTREQLGDVIRRVQNTGSRLRDVIIVGGR